MRSVKLSILLAIAALPAMAQFGSNARTLQHVGACIVGAVPCIPSVLAKMDATAQSANIGVTNIYTVPAGSGGSYLVTCYLVVTRAATSSSTLPNCGLLWTDLDSGVQNGGLYITASTTANGVGSSSPLANDSAWGVVVQAAPNTGIKIYTASYASSGATAMQYAIHAKLIYLGP